MADIRAELRQIRVVVHGSFTGADRSRESGLVGAGKTEFGVVGASGSIGAWSGRSQRRSVGVRAGALILSGDAEE